MSGLFIAGTDTGVGKTLVTASMLRAYAALGHRVVGMKPVAAGAALRGDAWVNEDVAQLREAANLQAPPELVNPYLFREPIAPHIAAEHKGVRIEIPRIRAAYETLAQQADMVLVEGVGGFRVPLSDAEDTADLAVALGLPIVLVVGMRLGCLNHALLTAEAIAARGLRLVAWVANRVEADMAAYDDNLRALSRRLPASLLAELPYQPGLSAAKAAGYFAPKRLAELLAQG